MSSRATGDRPAAGQPPRRRQGLAHRLGADRPEGGGSRRRQMKHVTMELGGKSPLIVFDDADLDGGRRRDARQFLFHRTGLLQRHPRLRAEGRQERVPRPPQGAHERRSASATPLDEATQMGRSSTAPSTTRSAPISNRQGRGRDARLPAADPEFCRARASMSSRPSSPT
jgi:hypothetical protein